LALVFANTLQNLNLNIFPENDMSDYCLRRNPFANGLPHWHFPYPELQSFAMSWKITHLDMNCFIMRRMLLHSPKLHTVEEVIQSCIATISVEFQRLIYFCFLF